VLRFEIALTYLRGDKLPSSPPHGSAQRKGNGTQEAQKRTQKAHEVANEPIYCASCVLFLCFLCSFPFSLGKAPPHRGGVAAPLKR
jgi:hypothetical protein